MEKIFCRSFLPWTGIVMPVIIRNYVKHSLVLLRDRLLELLPEQGSYPTSIPGLTLHRYDAGESPRPAVCAPVPGVVVQGGEWVRAEVEKYCYGPHSCFVAGVGMLASCCVQEATRERPCLALTIELDPVLMERLAGLACLRLTHAESSPLGEEGQKIDLEMMDSFVRLLDIISRPEQISFLAPLYLEEIHYRLLVSPLGRQLRDLHAATAQKHKATRRSLSPLRSVNMFKVKKLQSKRGKP